MCNNIKSFSRRIHPHSACIYTPYNFITTIRIQCGKRYPHSIHTYININPTTYLHNTYIRIAIFSDLINVHTRTSTWLFVCLVGRGVYIRWGLEGGFFFFFFKVFIFKALYTTANRFHPSVKYLFSIIINLLLVHCV